MLTLSRGPGKGYQTVRWEAPPDAPPNKKKLLLMAQAEAKKRERELWEKQKPEEAKAENTSIKTSINDMLQITLPESAIVRSDSGICISVVKINPEIADALLEGNTRNRIVKTSAVSSYARMMSSGEWELSADPIAIAKDGKTLLNGQHRLQAVVKSGATVQMLLSIGWPDGTVFDRGVPRTIGDSLYMRGEVDRKMSRSRLVAIAKNYLKVRDHRDPSETEIGVFMNEYPEDILGAFNASANGSNTPIARKVPIQIAVLAVALGHKATWETLQKFCKIVNTGMYDGPQETAAIVLRNKLLDIKKASGGYTGVMFDNIVMTAENALNDFIKGRQRQRPYTVLNHVFFKDK